jgi:hypothetical protein
MYKYNKVEVLYLEAPLKSRLARRGPTVQHGGSVGGASMGRAGGYYELMVCVIDVYFRPLDQHFSSSNTSIQCKGSDK